MSPNSPNLDRIDPTRAAGETYLNAFATRMGKRYTNGRNFDRGAGNHRDVSMIAPYIRCRLILEQDAVAIALKKHGAGGAEKFIQEVIWRGYFKGWMERRRRRNASCEPLAVHSARGSGR